MTPQPATPNPQQPMTPQTPGAPLTPQDFSNSLAVPASPGGAGGGYFDVNGGSNGHTAGTVVVASNRQPIVPVGSQPQQAFPQPVSRPVTLQPRDPPSAAIQV